jgi:hypothetical protein
MATTEYSHSQDGGHDHGGHRIDRDDTVSMIVTCPPELVLPEVWFWRGLI